MLSQQEVLTLLWEAVQRAGTTLNQEQFRVKTKVAEDENGSKKKHPSTTFHTAQQAMLRASSDPYRTLTNVQLRQITGRLQDTKVQGMEAGERSHGVALDEPESKHPSGRWPEAGSRAVVLPCE